MTRLDLDQIDRDDLADRRRERDRHREPPRWRRASPDLTRRRAFQAGVVDSVNTAKNSAAIALLCPCCGGPVFAPADSHGERVDCFNCDARLVTQRSAGGVVAVIAATNGGTP